MNKLLIFVENNFSQRDFERFGVETFQKNGFSVEVWDLTLVLSPNRATENNYQFHGYKRIKTFNELKKLVIDKNTLIITFITLSPARNKLFRLLDKRQLKYIIPYLGCVPTAPRKKGFMDIFRAITNPTKTLGFIYSKLPDTCKYKPNPYLYLCAGSIARQSVPKNDRNKILSTTTMDYIFLTQNKNTSKEHIVFLDEYEPFHPDYILTKSVTIKPYPYFDELNRFFDQLEQQYNQRVVIAAHPRSNDDYKQYFNNREVIKGKTAELVRNASLVLAHTSTSIQIAMLFNKPLILIKTSEMNTHNKNGIFNILKNNYKQNILEISERCKVQLYPNQENYLSSEGNNKYIENYVKEKDTLDLSPWDCLIKYLNSNLNS